MPAKPKRHRSLAVNTTILVTDKCLLVPCSSISVSFCLSQHQSLCKSMSNDVLKRTKLKKVLFSAEEELITLI